MIDLAKLTTPDAITTVTPSNRIFEELGNNTYDCKDVISELIDNAIASRLNDRMLQVSIDLFVDANSSPVEFLIKDNATGISKDKLGLAITPAGIHSQNSLNEHGLGMK